MKRRDFLKYSLASLALAGIDFNRLYAKESGVIQKPIIVNLVLDGGADFRHIFSPIFSEDKSSYGYNFWKNRASAHNLDSNNLASLQARSDEYLKVTKDNFSFGINPKASWLKDEFEKGNVAIVNNIINSTNRDHSHSLLKLESGEPLAGAHDFERSGWGGRLARELNANIVSLTRNVRLFCNAPNGDDWLNHNNDIVISASDSRNMGLYEYNTKADIENGEKRYKWSSKAILSRSLSSYYEAKRDLIAPNSPYYKFIQHEKLLIEFGRKINEKLATTPEPTALIELYDKNSDSVLESRYFAKQIRNLYDSLICRDILNMQVASLEYGGWDSHKKQIEWIEPKIEDIFGSDRGLDRVTKLIKQDMPEVSENVIFVISSEFGRQLASNGDNGTDHGRGSSVIIIGDGVNGGIYGDMFPKSEIERFSIPNEDINGLTSMEKLLASICNKFGDSVGDKIFNLKSSVVESGVDLSKIL